jgi:hypothetical protein
VADSEAAAAEVGAVNWNAIVAVLWGYPVPVPSTEKFTLLARYFDLPQVQMRCPVRGCTEGAVGEPDDAAEFAPAMNGHLAEAHPEAWFASRLRRGLAAT